MKKRAHKKLVKKILNNPVVRLKWLIEYNHTNTTPTYKDYMAFDKQTRKKFIKINADYFNCDKYVYDKYDGYEYYVLLNAYDERRATLVIVKPTLRDADGFIDSYVIESNHITTHITQNITHNRKRPSKITQKDIDEALDFINDIEKMKREIDLDELE